MNQAITRDNEVLEAQQRSEIAPPAFRGRHAEAEPGIRFAGLEGELVTDDAGAVRGPTPARNADVKLSFAQYSRQGEPLQRRGRAVAEGRLG